MTREEAIHNHRQLWKWLHDECLKQKRCIHKSEFFKHFNLNKILNDCYLCEYTQCSCDICPLEWKETYYGYYPPCIYSEYKEYLSYINDDKNRYKECAEICLKIANLPKIKY